jgi:hypothetical protein
LIELFGSEAKAARGQRGPASKLAQQIEVLAQMGDVPKSVERMS